MPHELLHRRDVMAASGIRAETVPAIAGYRALVAARGRAAR